MNVGQKIKQLRLENNLTQKDVADTLGISQSYISRLEKRIIVKLKKQIEKSGLVFGRDYGACYDSTMARFHYLNGHAQSVITQIMKEFPGHFLSKEEENFYGIYRPACRKGLRKDHGRGDHYPGGCGQSHILCPF